MIKYLCLLVDQLPTSCVCSPVLAPVHSHLNHVLQHLAAKSAGDAGGGAQGGAGVDLQEPGSQIIGQHEVSSVQFITILPRTATIHHI